MCHLLTWVYCQNSFSCFRELCHFNQFMGVVFHCTIEVVVFGCGYLNARARVLYYWPSVNELSQPTNRLHWRSFLQPQENKLRFSNARPYQTCLSQLFRYVGSFKARAAGYSQKSCVASKILKALANEDTLLWTQCCLHKCFPVCPRALHLLRTQILCPGHKKCFWFCSETLCNRNKCFPVCAAKETS